MAFSVKVENPAYPDDHTFEIVGLGEFTNGEEREITDDQERSFVSHNQKPLDEAIGEGGAVTFSGSTSIENMDDVLGVDISDHAPLPEMPEEEEAPQEEPTKEEAVTPAPTDTGGES